MKYKAPTPSTRWRVVPSLGLQQRKDKNHKLLCQTVKHFPTTQNKMAKCTHLTMPNPMLTMMTKIRANVLFTQDTSSAKMVSPGPEKHNTHCKTNFRVWGTLVRWHYKREANSLVHYNLFMVGFKIDLKDTQKWQKNKVNKSLVALFSKEQNTRTWLKLWTTLGPTSFKLLYFIMFK